MALAAVIISIVAVMTSAILGWRTLKLARHSNTMPVSIDLFREHRSERLGDARHFVYFDLPKLDLSLGMDALRGTSSLEKKPISTSPNGPSSGYARSGPSAEKSVASGAVSNQPSNNRPRQRDTPVDFSGQCAAVHGQYAKPRAPADVR